MVAFVDSRIAGVSDSQSKVVTPPIKVMTTVDVIFNVVGDIQILSLYSECYSANGAAASTLQYSVARYSDGGDNVIHVIQSKNASRPYGSHNSLRYSSTGKWNIGAGSGRSVAELVKMQVDAGIQRKRFKNIQLTHGEDIFWFDKMRVAI